MSVTVNDLFDTQQGKWVLISTVVALIFAYISIQIPLATPGNGAWYDSFYKDLTLPVKDRFNWTLVIVEVILLTFIYLFAIIGFGAYAELRNREPSWGEVFISIFLVLLMAYFVPKFSVGEGTISGTVSSSGINNFTPAMQTATFWLTVLMMVIITLWTIYSAPKEEK